MERRLGAILAADIVGYGHLMEADEAGTPTALKARRTLLIYFLCARLARPIESVSQELKSIEGLSFSGPSMRRSRIKEIAQLQSAAALLRSSLQSFSSFVPLD